MTTAYTGNPVDAPHMVVVGIGIMLVFAVIATEVGGTSHGNAELIILVLLGLLILLGITHMGNFTGWAQLNPFVPTAAQQQQQQALYVSSPR